MRSFLLLLALIAVLQGVCELDLIAPTTLPPPTRLFASLYVVLANRVNIFTILLSLGDIVIASAIAGLGGFALGVVLHRFELLRRGVEPLLTSYYAVPTFIFYPVLVVILGAGRAPIIAIAVALAIVAMIGATLTGLDRMPPVLTRTARVLRLSPLQTALRIQLPAIAPDLFTGMKLVISYAFIGVIASEFILSGEGIGYAIAYAYNNFDNTTMYGLILFVMIVAALLNMLLAQLDHRLRAR